MKKLINLAAIGSIALAITACGDDVTNVTENNVGVQSFESFKKLPKCTKENQGEMAIATKEGLVYYCDDKEWKTLNGKDGIDGKDGAKGETGAKGDTGVAGENGTSCTAESTEEGVKITCDDGFENTIENGKPGDNCSMNDNGEGVVTITCGEKSADFVKAFCGLNPFDPANKFCYEGKSYEYCDGKSFNPDEKICRDGVLKDYFIDERNVPYPKQKYSMVTIGSQTWMAENLRYWGGKKSARYNGDIQKYGLYYTWAEAMDKTEDECGTEKTCGVETFPHKGICPTGWHLPTVEEWETLVNYIKEKEQINESEVGEFLKAVNWDEHEDSYGFSAYPSGEIEKNGNFFLVNKFAYFWTANEYNKDSGKCYLITNEQNSIEEYSENKDVAMPVRCIKNVD